MKVSSEGIPNIGNRLRANIPQWALTHLRLPRLLRTEAENAWKSAHHSSCGVENQDQSITLACATPFQTAGSSRETTFCTYIFFLSVMKRSRKDREGVWKANDWIWRPSIP